jgi:hypothetical protein
MHLLSMMTAALAISVGAPAPAAGPAWHIAGKLSEACSCAVPCACNFGESPSPHAFCWAVFALDIDDGSLGDVSLAGLRLAGANGAKGMVWYIDDRADARQADALKQIATTMHHKALAANGIKDFSKPPTEFKLLGYKRAKIEQVVNDRKSYLKIVGAGGFSADYIVGLDGKTPVTVANNWSWNIKDGIKARTHQLAYHDSFGNKYDFTKTNANQGTFDWSDSTPVYFR